jgi:hypothetical protein
MTVVQSVSFEIAPNEQNPERERLKAASAVQKAALSSCLGSLQVTLMHIDERRRFQAETNLLLGVSDSELAAQKRSDAEADQMHAPGGAGHSLGRWRWPWRLSSQYHWLWWWLVLWLGRH